MGKVKESAVGTSLASPRTQASGERQSTVAAFLGNLVSTAVYKPLQGKQARLWTGIGLGATIALGLYELSQTLFGVQFSASVVYGVPVLIGAVLGWIVFRLVQFPPFVDFLIATEAEMTKVNWTSQDDLKRATLVVLFTVAFLAVFLFGVDWLWSSLLQVLRVLRFRDTSSLGSTA